MRVGFVLRSVEDLPLFRLFVPLAKCHCAAPTVRKLEMGGGLYLPTTVGYGLHYTRPKGLGVVW